jgi:uncharacterized protein involved in exopolysaccharide biosynthesis
MTSAAAPPGDDLTPTERAAPHLRSLVRYSWVVLLLAAIAAVIAVLMSEHQTKRYDATAAVLLTSSEPVNVLLQSTGLPSGDPERDLNTDVALVKVAPVAAEVKRTLHLDWPTTKLLAEVRAALSGSSNMVAITARDSSPKRAAAIANAFARSYVSFRRQAAQDAYAEAARLARLRLANLTPQQRKAKLGTSLRLQLRQLETAGYLQTGGAQLVAGAELPTEAATPRPKFEAAVAGTVGLLFGALLAIGLGALERRREPREDEAAVGETAPAGAGAAARAGRLAR